MAALTDCFQILTKLITYYITNKGRHIALVDMNLSAKSNFITWVAQTDLEQHLIVEW
jgi:hypothetical protein